MVGNIDLEGCMHLWGCVTDIQETKVTQKAYPQKALDANNVLKVIKVDFRPSKGTGFASVSGS